MSTKVTAGNATANSVDAPVTAPKGEWKSQLALKAETLALWRLMQQIRPDEQTKKIQKTVELLPGYEEGSLELAQRLRHWQVATGLSTDEILGIVADTTLDMTAQAVMPNSHIAVLANLLELPLHELNKGATTISNIVSQVLPKDQIDGAKKAMEVCGHIDQALTLADLALSVSQVWALDKQITLVKEALEPVEEAQRELLEAKANKLQEEMKQLQAKETFAFAPERLAKLMELMLLQVRLHPSSNRGFKAVIEEAVKKMEAHKATSVDVAKSAAWMLGIDIVVVILDAVDPTSLASKIVSLAVKAQSASGVLSGFKAAWSKVKEGVDQKSLANRTFKLLDEAATTPAERKLLETASKVKSVYWNTKTSQLAENATTKTLGTAATVIGITLLILKILAIIGVIAIGAAALAGMGYATLAIAGAILLIKLIMVIYRNREWIAVQMQRIGVAVCEAFNSIAEKMGVDRSESVKELQMRARRLDRRMKCFKAAKKTSAVSHALLQKLDRDLKGAVGPNALTVGKAQLLVQSITGREAAHLKGLKPGEVSEQELCDRTLASILEQISS